MLNSSGGFSQDVALFVVSQLLAPHAARVLAAEQAAEEEEGVRLQRRRDGIWLIWFHSQAAEEGAAAEATAPRRAADAATAEETPPLELTAPLQALSLMNER